MDSTQKQPQTQIALRSGYLPAIAHATNHTVVAGDHAVPQGDIDEAAVAAYGIHEITPFMHTMNDKLTYADVPSQDSKQDAKPKDKPDLSTIFLAGS